MEYTTLLDDRIADYTKKKNVHNQLDYLLKSRKALRIKLKTTRWKSNSKQLIDDTIQELDMVNNYISYQILRINVIDEDTLQFGG